MTIAHLVAYTAIKSNGDTFNGIAHVDAAQFAPTAAQQAEIEDAAQATIRFATVTGTTYLGRASYRMFVLAWQVDGEQRSRWASWAEVCHLGEHVRRLVEAGRASHVRVLDGQRVNRADHFPVFHELPTEACA